MKYPNFLTLNSQIGVVALSSGVGKYLEEYKKSLYNIEKYGFKVVETASVRNESEPANTGEIRAKELDRLVTDPDIDFIMCATGGDFLLEILPFVNLSNIEKNPKWFMGASDPTSILYLITTYLDIATIYGSNACSFDHEMLHQSEKNLFEIIQGNIVEQNSFPLYEKDKSQRTTGYALTEKVYWETLNGPVDIKGRIIGGCIECLKDLIGTKFDYTKEFLHRYQEEGIIWYFDIFSLTSEDFYRTLLQFKEAGWFENTKGIIVGRVMFPNSFTELTYQEALKKAFNDNIPIIFNADIGHVAPKMTIINGSIAHIISENGKGTISFELK